MSLASSAASPSGSSVASVAPPPPPPQVSSAWRAARPALAAAFARVAAADSDPAVSASAHASLSTALLTAHRCGVYRALQAELPSLLTSTGRPLDTLAEVLTRLQPRIAAERRTAAAAAADNPGRNAKQNARAGAKAGAQVITQESQATDAASPAVGAAASASTAPPPSPSTSLPLPSGLPDWFSALTSRTNFASIGSAHHHSLQLLMIESADALHIAPSAEQQTRAREQLIPLWIQVPKMVSALLAMFKLVDEDSGVDEAATDNSSAVAVAASSAAASDALPSASVSVPSSAPASASSACLVPAASILYYYRCLASCGHHADAAAFLLGFPSASVLTASLLSAAGGAASLLRPLLHRSATMGWDLLAVSLADAHPTLRDTCVRLLCTQAHKSPTSLKCIQRWGMGPALFPEVTHDLASRQLHWLVREGKAVELGSEVCGSDVKLQTLLVRELMLAGLLDQAEEIIDQFQLRGNAELTAELAQHQADRAAGLTKAPPASKSGAASGPFLCMPASIPITFVTASDPSSLQRASEGLSESATDAVGLDLEFGFTGSSSNQPALLQIATRSQVFLFDLLSFAGCESMSLTLQRLFTSPHIRKIGYAWDGDWKVLRSGFPGADAFRAQTNVLDMADPAKALDQWESKQEAEKEAAERKRKAIETSAAAEQAAATAAAPAPAPSADPDVSPEQPAETADADADKADDDDAAAAMDDSACEPVTELAAVTAAIKQSIEEGDDEANTEEAGNAEATADATAASESTVSASTAAAASPSREARRKAKKVVKKASRNALKAAARASDDATASAPVVRKGVARGLSALALLCLGLPLDKHYQISAWRRRPLKPEQLHYAALDAYCLLGIRDAFFDADKMHPLLRQAQIGEEEKFVRYDTQNNSAAAAAATSPSSASAAPDAVSKL